MIRKRIVQSLEKISKKLGLAGEKIVVEYQKDPNRGDYSTNLALQQQKLIIGKVWQTSLAIAKKIAESFPKKDYLEKIEAVPPGFINFFVKKEVWKKELEQTLKEKGLNLNLENRQILVEFAHPNTHKLFHIGHLRNITIGESICRLLEAVGNRVFRVNYQGDIGLHIAKALWGIKKLGFGKPASLENKIDFLSKAYILGNKSYEENTQVKNEIDEINLKLYQRDPELVRIWQETKNWSLEYFQQIYKRVRTKFDRLYFESEVANLGKEEVLKFAQKGIFVKSKGAIIFPGEKYGLHDRVFVTKLGLATYEAKDVGLAKLQFSEYSPDLIIHVVGPEQKGYFEVVFKMLEQIYPFTTGKELHLLYGWVRLKTGKMSSRKGEVVTADWLFDKAKKKALSILDSSEIKKDRIDREDVSEKVAIGAVKYSFLKMSLAQDLIFDLNESINLEGNSGPYLQYTYARCESVLAKTKEIASQFTSDNPEPIEELLLRKIGLFKEVVADAAQNFSPNILANFLYEVAQKYNNFYNNLPILKAKSTLRLQRLFLTKATANMLKKGLYLLGIEAPEKM